MCVPIEPVSLKPNLSLLRNKLGLKPHLWPIPQLIGQPTHKIVQFEP